MSAAKHTPGSWEVRARHLNDVRIEAGIKAGPVSTICSMSNWLPEFLDERAANARLIATSPELFAIAELVANLGQYADLIEKMAEVLRPHERAAFIHLFRTGAPAAIAKATGSAA